MAIILLVSAYMCADIVSILCDKKEEKEMTTPINFITMPDFAARNQEDVSISIAIKAVIVDYPRLTDPVDKAASTLLITQYDKIFQFDEYSIKEDLEFVKDYFLQKFAKDVAQDMIYVFSHDQEVKARLDAIANMKWR